MNSKAIKRQLLAAIAMVLVAAIALGSSTYAWFVASGTVTAEGMKVQAQAEGNLVIRYKQGNWGTVATATPTQKATLLPASTDNLTNWVYSPAKEPGKYVSDGHYENIKAKVNPGVDDGGRETGYVMVKEFEIRSATGNTADAPMGLYVDEIKVTRGTTQQNMSGAMRVGLQVTYDGTTTPFIYAPVGTGNNAPKYGLRDGVSDETSTDRGVHVFDTNGDIVFKNVTLSEAGWGTDAPKTVLLDGETRLPTAAETNKVVKVYIYIWFEGEDVNLYSDNFAVEEMDISVSFQSISGHSDTTTA